MVKIKLAFLIVLCFWLPEVVAQTHTPTTVMQSVNQQLVAIPRGYFDCTYRWKSALKTDTSQKSGRIWFFKRPGDPDSIGKFIVTGEVWEAYDGTDYYRISSKNKTIISYPVAEKGGVKKVLDGRATHRLVFRPYIFGPERSPFKLEKFGNAIVDTVDAGRDQFVRITVRDSFPNDMKLAAKDPNLIQRKETFDLSLPDLSIRKKTDWILFSHSPQYLEQHLSPIYPLPDSVTFEQVFNLDSLLRAGYTRERQTVATLPPRPALIAVGDTLPPFSLQDLDGQRISTSDMKHGLLLLDFWYKSCAPCLMSMPSTERLYQKYRNRGLMLYGINGTDKDPSDLKIFLEAREVSYPSLLDTEKKLAVALHVHVYPTFILAEAQTRRILYANSGFAPKVEEELSALIEQFLKY